MYKSQDPEHAAEHKRLVALLELARSDSPLTITQTAELIDISPERVRQIQVLALYKAKKEILTNHKDLLRPTKPNQ